MHFNVYRDCDKRLRLRKVVVELWEGEDFKAQLVDRRRMFAGPFFFDRLVKKMERMLKFADKVAAAKKLVIP